MNVKHIIAYDTFFSSFFLEKERVFLSTERKSEKGTTWKSSFSFIWFYHCRYWSSSATRSSGKLLLLSLALFTLLRFATSALRPKKCCAHIIILFLISIFSLGSFQIYAIYRAISRRLVIPFNKKKGDFGWQWKTFHFILYTYILQMYYISLLNVIKTEIITVEIRVDIVITMIVINCTTKSRFCPYCWLWYFVLLSSFHSWMEHFWIDTKACARQVGIS